MSVNKKKQTCNYCPEDKCLLDCKICNPSNNNDYECDSNKMETTTNVQKRREMPSWGWWVLIAYMVTSGFLFSPEIESWALATGWFAFGAACLLNFKSCGRIHCSITGPGFLGLGAVWVIKATGIIDIPEWVTWAAFAAIMAVGFGLEFRQKKICGTCYSNKFSKES